MIAIRVIRGVARVTWEVLERLPEFIALAFGAIAVLGYFGFF